jgi:hypothetical protein
VDYQVYALKRTMPFLVSVYRTAGTASQVNNEDTFFWLKSIIFEDTNEC